MPLRSPSASARSIVGEGTTPATAPRRYPGRAASYALAIAGFSALLASGLVRCPTALVFGIPCPGCGSTRAARALLALDIRAAMHFNPVAPLMIALLGGLALRLLLLVYRDGDGARLDAGRLGRSLIALLVAASSLQIIVWIARFFGFFGGPCPIG